MGEQQAVQDAEGPLRAARPLHLQHTLSHSAAISFVVTSFLCQQIFREGFTDQK